MLLPAMIVAGPVLTTLRSADVSTVVFAVEVLLPGVGSAVVEVTLATLASVEPLASLLTTCSTIFFDDAAPADILAIFLFMFPPVLVNVNAGPLFCTCD